MRYAWVCVIVMRDVPVPLRVAWTHMGGGYMRGYARLFWKGEFEGETFCGGFSLALSFES